MKAGNILVFLLIGSAITVYSSCNNAAPSTNVTVVNQPDSLWSAPDSSYLGTNSDAERIRYGRKLVENTSYYLGPQGTVAHISNGLNCQNCHLQAGTKPYGNNFALVAAGYPRMSPRSGKTENIETRINECMMRSMNGQTLDTNSKEIKAIEAYIKWVGKGITKNNPPKGAGSIEVALLDRAADTMKGKDVYLQKCQACHGISGAGLMNTAGTGYTYPPLWGEHSYNRGAGILRLSRLARFIKNNMPLGATYNAPQLTDEEAWDIAAYINSQPRPDFDMSHDWPDLHNKPIDYPVGPYTDSFPQVQHTYGPFKPIAEARNQKEKTGK